MLIRAIATNGRTVKKPTWSSSFYFETLACAFRLKRPQFVWGNCEGEDWTRRRRKQTENAQRHASWNAGMVVCSAPSWELVLSSLCWNIYLEYTNQNCFWNKFVRQRWQKTNQFVLMFVFLTQLWGWYRTSRTMCCQEKRRKITLWQKEKTSKKHIFQNFSPDLFFSQHFWKKPHKYLLQKSFKAWHH